MTGWIQRNVTRRTFVAASAMSAVALVACGDSDDGDDGGSDDTATSAPAPTEGAPTQAATAQSSSGATTLPATPACGDDDEPTVVQTDGPYFSPNSPERASLLDPGIAGTTLVLAGAVLSTQCAPVAGAVVDFWQADNDGIYDNEGFTLRGHQFTDADGRYRLETIVPGQYPGRTRHIHVKVQAPDCDQLLTTQLYFPDEPGNASDGIYDAALVMAVQDAATGKTATFDFVLDLG